MSEQQYRLPDLLRDWPWTRRLSEDYAEVKAESSSWIQSFHPFSQKGQKSFDACDLNLLASLTYSNRNKEFVRLGCDLMNFYFVYDEYTDVAEPSAASELADGVIEVMENSQTLSTGGTHLLAEMTRQFMRRSESFAAPGSQCIERFIQTSKTYLHAVTQEAEDRASNRVRTLDEYMALRRNTCGAQPTLILTEFGLDLPNLVTSHPVLKSLMEDAVDLIIFVNDMHSYARELSCDLAVHNVITAIRHEHDLDLQGALDWLGAYSDRVVSRFLQNVQHVPSWGPDIDDRVKVYLDGMGQWVRGNDDWSYETERYHGCSGGQVKETRFISVGPRTPNYLTLAEDSREIKRVVTPQSNQMKRMGMKLQMWWSLFSGGTIIRYIFSRASTTLKWKSQS